MLTFCSCLLLGRSSLLRVDRFSTMSTVCTRILFISWLFKKPFPSAPKEISQTNGRLRDIQVVAVLEDVDVVVTEIISITVEVVPVTVVDTSPTEDVAVIVMLLTLLTLKLVLLPLLKDMVLPDVGVLNPLQVVVMDRVVVQFTPLVVTTVLPVLVGDGKAVVLIVCIKAVVNLLLILHIVRTSTIRVKVTLTKNTKKTATLKEKNSIMKNSRTITTRKDKWKKENSVMRKLVSKKWNKL